MVDEVILGGPAYESKQLDKGDILTQIDRCQVSVTDVQQRLAGSDIVGSTVTLTVCKKSGRTVDVILKRIDSSALSDRFTIVKLFHECKVNIFFLCSRPAKNSMIFYSVRSELRYRQILL